MKVTIKIDEREYLMPRAFRAAHLLAEGGRDGTYRIFQDVDGLLGAQIHPSEWVIPSNGDKFVCVPYAVGPGGGDDWRVSLIRAAIDTEDGNVDAWDRIEEAERNSP